MVTRLHLPYAILVRLHVRKSNVVTLTPETVCTVGVWAVAYLCRFSIKDEAMDVDWSAPQVANYHADVIYLLP